MRRTVSIIIAFCAAGLVLSGQPKTYMQMAEEMPRQAIEANFEARLSEAVAVYEPASHWVLVNPIQLSGEVWVSGRGMYEYPTCRNAMFFRKNADGDFVPVFSEEMPEESVRTICSVDCGLDITANLTFNRYGFKADHAKCPVGALVGFCLNEGCMPFVQIESRDDKEIVAALIMVNKPAGYNHVFKFEVPTPVLKDAKGSIDVTLNAYVPTHNVNDLYSDKKDK